MRSIQLLCIAVSIFAVSCKSTKPMTAYSPGSFDKQAHRGGRGLMPENTLPAMLNALELGATTLEMDVVISGDRKVLLSHEPFFNQDITTKPDGTYIDSNAREHNIYQMDYSLARTYDVGLKPYPLFPRQKKLAAVKPLLSEVFVAVKEFMVTAKRPFPFFNIETKISPATDNIFHPAPEIFCELLMSVIKEYEMQSQVIIQSFDARSLQYIHKNYPSIQTSLLVEPNNLSSLRKQIRDLGYIPNIYSPHESLVNANLVNECHVLGMKVIPWTVNEKVRIDQLRSMGIDGIITDYPDLF